MPSSSDENTTSASRPFESQRVYSKVRLGLARVEERLRTTAYTVLAQAEKDTILESIKTELRTNIRKDQENMPARTQLDYGKLAEGCIRKVFEDNLALFKAGPEDNPGVDELMDYSG